MLDWDNTIIICILHFCLPYVMGSQWPSDRFIINESLKLYSACILVQWNEYKLIVVQRGIVDFKTFILFNKYGYGILVSNVKMAVIFYRSFETSGSWWTDLGWPTFASWQRPLVLSSVVSWQVLFVLMILLVDCLIGRRHKVWECVGYIMELGVSGRLLWFSEAHLFTIGQSIRFLLLFWYRKSASLLFSTWGLENLYLLFSAFQIVQVLGLCIVARERFCGFLLRILDFSLSETSSLIR